MVGGKGEGWNHSTLERRGELRYFRGRGRGEEGDGGGEPLYFR